MKDIIKEFRENFKCTNPYCDGNGIIPVQVGEDEWEPEQCEFHAKYLLPIENFLQKAISQTQKEAYEKGRLETIKEIERELPTESTKNRITDDYKDGCMMGFNMCLHEVQCLIKKKI